MEEVEEEDMKWLEESELEDAESMNDEEDDPDWSSQLEESGKDDIDADDEEKESPCLNNIRQEIMISCWHSIHMTTFFPEKVNVKLIQSYSKGFLIHFATSGSRVCAATFTLLAFARIFVRMFLRSTLVLH